MPSTRAASESSFLAKIDGIDDFWATMTGGGTNRETSKAFNGGEKYPIVIAGKTQVDDIVLTRPYDPVRDAQVIRTLRQNENRKWTVSRQPTDENGLRIGQPTVYPEVIVLKVDEPDVNAASSSPAMLSVTLGASRVV